MAHFEKAFPGFKPGPLSLKPDAAALDVARAIVRCAKRPRPEVYPYPLARAVVWLNAFAPSLADWVWARSARKAGRV